MSTIRCIYQNDAPNFPATDQHPDAVRYQVGAYIVDAIGGEPTLAEVEAKINPPPPTAEELEAQALAALNGGGPIEMRKLVKAIVISNLAHRLGKLPGALTAGELGAERNRIAALYKAL